MPTPVPAARQCLTDEAARALDDAVAVARRRNHAQTTSLHVVSAFLSSPSSLFSSACSRAARSTTANFSPRLQFRALDLSVGVSLDRLPTSKHSTHNNNNDVGDDAFSPPISNSLMAAIKRSQANQRRQPEIYHHHHHHHHHLSSIQGNPVSITSIKVELKQFVLSILDDPVVNRVFGEAGFRSCDIKLAIIHPPSSPSFNLRARCPLLFLCNLLEFGARSHGMLPIPLDSNRDEYCKRIGEVMIRKSGRNPVLVGVGGVDALSRFRECVEKGRNSELPSEIHGLRFISVENDIKELVRNGDGGEEAVEAKAKELEMMLERSGVAGVVVSIGGLEALVEGGVAKDALNRLVLKLSGLMRVRREKMWLMGSAAVYETYSRFLERFPPIEKDWDLQPLPITSSKSSLMGSFVPFAGFFSRPSDFKSPLPVMNQCFTRCGECNENCEREISAAWQGGSSASMVDKCSTSLPTCLQMADFDSNRTENVAPETTKDDKAASKSTVLAIERKWDDICKDHQRIPTAYGPGISLPRPETPHAVGFPFAAKRPGSERGDVSLNERVSSGLSSCLPHDRYSSSSPTSRLYATTLPFDHISCSSNSVTTDLGLGMVSAYKNPEPKAVGFENHWERSRYPSNTVGDLDKVNGKIPTPIMQSSSPTGPELLAALDPAEYKALYRKLIASVGWQQDAIHSISQLVLSCRSRIETRGLNTRRDIWLSFSGPDIIGKKKVAEALAEAIFGSRESLVSVDLSCQGWTSDPSSIFSCAGPKEMDKVSRKTIVGHMAEELSKRPHSVVFLENVDEADMLVQGSLFRAIRAGKFADPHRREISISNMIFVICTTPREKKDECCQNQNVRFPEQRVLEARKWHMRIAVTDRKDVSHQLSPNKRKLSTSNSKEDSTKKTSKIYIDLNLPLDESEDSTVLENSDSASVSGNSTAWFQDFLMLLHGSVEFKPFNFDALADQLMSEITFLFQRTLGSETNVEVEGDVMQLGLRPKMKSWTIGFSRFWGLPSLKHDKGAASHHDPWLDLSLVKEFATENKLQEFVFPPESALGEAILARLVDSKPSLGAFVACNVSLVATYRLIFRLEEIMFSTSGIEFDLVGFYLTM
ncbi:SMAX1-LIKE 7-like protein [Drosera capensis]